jgi:hypothetical protein
VLRERNLWLFDLPMPPLLPLCHDPTAVTSAIELAQARLHRNVAFSQEHVTGHFTSANHRILDVDIEDPIA